MGQRTVKRVPLDFDWPDGEVWKGYLISDGQCDEADEWEHEEPPTGAGWQLWETTSEGSPISPVFASAEELADWCEVNATWFGSLKWNRKQWLDSFQAGTIDVDSLLTLRETVDG